MVRLVFGLGTRAVDRSDDDYTRVVALNAPERRPESDFDEVRQYSQRKVDVIDLEANQLVSLRLRRRGPAQSRSCRVDMFASDDRDAGAAWRPSEPAQRCHPGAHLRQLLSRDAVRRRHARRCSRPCRTAYDYPGGRGVHGQFLRQGPATRSTWCSAGRCRSPPAAAWPSSCPQTIAEQDLVLEAARGGDRPEPGRARSTGWSTSCRRSTASLPIARPLRGGPADRPAAAPATSRRRRSTSCSSGRAAGEPPRRRWACPSPSPRSTRVSVLCEIVAMREDLVPDVSLGTHFFNDLVEMDILYLALFPGRRNNHAIASSSRRDAQPPDRTGPQCGAMVERGPGDRHPADPRRSPCAKNARRYDRAKSGLLSCLRIRFCLAQAKR